MNSEAQQGKGPVASPIKHISEIRKKKTKNGPAFYYKFQILCKCILAFIRDCSIRKRLWLFINTWTNSLLRSTCRRPECVSAHFYFFIGKTSFWAESKSNHHTFPKQDTSVSSLIPEKNWIKTIACMWSLKYKKNPRAFGKKNSEVFSKKFFVNSE